MINSGKPVLTLLGGSTIAEVDKSSRGVCVCAWSGLVKKQKLITGPSKMHLHYKNCINSLIAAALFLIEDY